MKVDLQHVSVKITREQPLRLMHARGTSVAVIWGEVWLTQEGDFADYVLRAGDLMRLNSDGLTLLHALENAGVSLLEPCVDDDVTPTQASGYLAMDTVPYYEQLARDMRADYIARGIDSLSHGLRNLWSKLGLRLRQRRLSGSPDHRRFSYLP